MLDRLPEYIDPLQLADRRSNLKGQIPLSRLDRLADLLMNDTGAVSVDLVFSREGSLAKIEGRIESILELECQNCLQAVSWPVDSAIRLGIVSSIDQADKLPDDYEPLLLENEKILLKDIIEDELLLILPQYPKHQHDCLARNPDSNSTETPSDKDAESHQKNPFSILANLKKTGDL